MTIPLLNFGSIKVLWSIIKSASAKALNFIDIRRERMNPTANLPSSIIFLILE
jgi:hypothetical protein